MEMRAITDEYELKNVLEKVIEVIVEEVPRILNNDCRKIILYGSCARGDYSRDSDVDIMILTDSDRIQVKKYNKYLDNLVIDIAMDTLSVVNIVCIPYEEFEDKKTWYPFFVNIVKDGVTLYEK